MAFISKMLFEGSSKVRTITGGFTKLGGTLAHGVYQNCIGKTTVDLKNQNLTLSAHFPSCHTRYGDIHRPLVAPNIHFTIMRSPENGIMAPDYLLKYEVSTQAGETKHSLAPLKVGETIIVGPESKFKLIELPPHVPAKCFAITLLPGDRLQIEAFSTIRPRNLDGLGIKKLWTDGNLYINIEVSDKTRSSAEENAKFRIRNEDVEEIVQGMIFEARARAMKETVFHTGKRTNREKQTAQTNALPEKTEVIIDMPPEEIRTEDP